MSPLRKTAFAAGALYLLSFVSIPTLFLYNPLRASNYILGHGSNTGIIVGAILEMIVALAGIGTAVALFPVVKRQNEGVALGFVGTRTLEGGALLAGAACVLSLVTLQQAGAGTNGLVMGHTLISMYDRIFLLGGSFMPAVNALLIGSLLYQSRLVPRWLPIRRSDPAGRWRRRRDLRSHRAACRHDTAVRNRDRSLGVFAGRLLGRQRLQALGHHRPLQPTCRRGRFPGPCGRYSVKFPASTRHSSEPGVGRAPTSLAKPCRHSGQCIAPSARLARLAAWSL